MSHQPINSFPALVAISLAMLTSTSIQTVVACEPATYSISSQQLTFSALAVENYQPYTAIPNGNYTLCTGKDAPIVMQYQSGRDFIFPKKRAKGPNEPPQEIQCESEITSAENCYPTYSSKNGQLSFPEVNVPWRAILPLGNTVEVGGSCYEAVMVQGTLLPEVFTLTQLTEKNCQ